MADDLIIAFFVFTFLGIGFTAIMKIAAEERRQRPLRTHRADIRRVQRPTSVGSDDSRLAA